ncbi:MAG: ABC transporter ATP-binding protein [Nitrososphaerota archaeon]|nr:ABC transporter ATP-binding protein [Candidatus Calditenuaceae archaeon]MDW8073877.1 ABC transporter ATP-binding protein [Nitrososphaerota archaeon]
MARTLIEVAGLWKSFNGEPAVRGLNLAVGEGEIHGLLGLNGAGKTTTIKCVVGLLRPDRGEIRVAGRSVFTDSSFKDFLGYLPENPSLPEYLTAEEFLVFSSRLKGLRDGEVGRRVSEAVELFGLRRYLDRLIFELSKGVRQRIAFAAAIVNTPQILILDEPFNGLDPEAQSVAKFLMRETAERGGAVLVSTHLLDSIERVCDSATIIHTGRELASGTLNELRSLAGLSSSAPLEEAFLRIVSRSRT